MTLAHFVFAVLFPFMGPACALVASCTLVRPRSWSPAAKAAAYAAILVCSMKFTWFAVFGGRMFLPELPAWVIHALSVAYDVVLLLAAVGVCAAAARAAAGLARRLRGGGHGAPEPSSGRFAQLRRRDFLVGCLSAATVPAAVATVRAGIRLPDVRRVELYFPDLPPAFDGYRIVQLSDLHISAAARAERTKGVVRLANACDPDLVVVTGDIVDGTVRAHLEDVEPLGGLVAKDGVLGCNGNHEYYSDPARWAVEFDRLGLRVLRNAAATIRRGGDAVTVIGQDDPVGGDTDISAAAASAAPFRILLAHRPTRIAEHAAMGVRLQLSGHTHGGAVLGLDRLVARSNEGHVRGLYREHGLTLYVNAGTGQWAGFPERAGVPTEITEIVLRRGVDGCVEI